LATFFAATPIVTSSFVITTLMTKTYCDLLRFLTVALLQVGRFIYTVYRICHLCRSIYCPSGSIALFSVDRITFAMYVIICYRSVYCTTITTGIAVR